jgi:membrane fusion protein, copper/silver efflux system
VPFYSKVSGTVNEIIATEGSYVNEGSAILNIADYSTVWIEAEAYPDDSKFISVGLKVKIKIEAYPAEEIDGTISFENPELESQSKINLVRIEIQNKDKNSNRA